MLSSEAASQLGLEETHPPQIVNMSFRGEDSLWVKEKHHLAFEKLGGAKKYEYSKVGRMFGFEVRRYISLCHDHFFYFDVMFFHNKDQEETDYLGYCCLENKYVHWTRVQDGRFLLLISNGVETTAFYFDNDSFWKEQQDEVAQYAVQVNFGQRFTLGELVGEGTFSKVHPHPPRSSRPKTTAPMILSPSRSSPKIAKALPKLSVMRRSCCDC